MSNPSFIDVHCGFGSTVAARHWGEADAIREAMLQRGIGMAFASSLSARTYDPIEGNDELAKMVGTGDESVDLRGWLVVHPSRAEDGHVQMRKYLLSSRFVGVALYPDPLTGLPILARNAAEAVTSFRRYSKPVLVHAPTAAAMYEVVRLSQDFNGVKFIASGMGGEEWREAIQMSTKPLNLYLDISGSLCPDKIDYALEEMGGIRKLLFASGAPMTDPAAVLAMLFESHLSEDDRAKVLYGNAQRLFGFVTHEDEDAPDLAPMGG